MTSSTPFRSWIVPLALSAYFLFALGAKMFPALQEHIGFALYLFTFLALGVVSCLVAVWMALMRLGGKPTPRARAVERIVWTGAATFIVTFVLMRVLPNPLPAGSDKLAFDRESWLKESSTEYVPNSGQKYSIRQQMLGSVVHKVLPGRDRASIEAELGEQWDSERYRAQGLVYLLGRTRPVPLDNEVLLIHFDENGRYVRYTIAED